MVVKEKDQAIETLRGIAIILMVAGHIVRGSAFEPLDGYSAYRHFSFSFDYFRMPLFTVISGFVYAMRPVREKLWAFYGGKSRRLLLPLVAVASFEFLCRRYVPGVAVSQPLNEMWRIYFFGYFHLWFIQALFVIFLVIGLLDYHGLLDRFSWWLVAFVGAVLVNIFFPRPEFFSVGAACYLIPFFILGCGLNRFSPFFAKRSVRTVSWTLVCLGVAVQQATWFEGISLDGYELKALAVLGGVFGNILFLQLRWVWQPLAFIGSYAYTIYLFHGFSMAIGGRVATSIAGGTSHYLNMLLVLALSLGVGLPIMVEYLLRDKNWFRVPFLGLRPVQRHQVRLSPAVE